MLLTVIRAPFVTTVNSVGTFPKLPPFTLTRTLSRRRMDKDSLLRKKIFAHLTVIMKTTFAHEHGRGAALVSRSLMCWCCFWDSPL